MESVVRRRLDEAGLAEAASLAEHRITRVLRVMSTTSD
jgi:hypothetical protein